MLQRICVLFTCLFFAPGLLSAAESSARDQIRERVELIRSDGNLTIGTETIASVQVLPALYENRDYTPVWSRSDSIDQLFAALETIDGDGLDAADYHYRTLSGLRARIAKARSTDPTLAADYDILLTDSLVRLGYHLLVGKVDPVELDNNWNMTDTIGDLDTALALALAIDKGTVDELVELLRPQLPVYAELRATLARYRDIRQRGGWQAVTPGPVLKAGMTDPRVRELRQRLAATGDMAVAGPASTLFDADVESGVKKFQRRHALEADGIAGKATLQAMNVPVQDRIDQIRVNLERARWVLHKLPDEYVLTDIAGFRVIYFRNGEVIWESRAQVGKPYRKTPVFRSRITYLDINPTWTVPPTILKNDILPRLKKDPDYLRRKNMRVITFDGKPVDESTIDWSRYPAESFPYMIRQNPGPKNALGRIKFMFPNKHAVYLHDTPSKSLFAKTERALSSGCIRIENPYDFGELLLNSDQWDKARIEATVATGKTTRVSLDNPVTVILMYWTVDTTDAGDVIFRNDIYKRDPAVLSALQRPFRFRKSPVLTP
ncbi:MAG: murein L,D-transpeptidase [Thiogranum sp.]